tara:strand:- start:1014 stop:1265 length:252 start_codon:yes stop_codon:yes gene_type:complete
LIRPELIYDSICFSRIALYGVTSEDSYINYSEVDMFSEQEPPTVQAVFKEGSHKLFIQVIAVADGILDTTVWLLLFSISKVVK